MNEEIKMYEEQGNWDFSHIDFESEYLNNWNMYDEAKKYLNEKSLILDLGTGGGENVLSNLKDRVGMIIGTDLSPNMIKTANENLKKYPNVKAKFVVMDNLNIEFPDGLFDLVLARNTVINASEIFRVLKDDGILIVRGVDKYDCWKLKELFGRGQSFNDETKMSEKDFNDIKEEGFKDIQLKEIDVNEYYKTKEDLLKLLLKAPILDESSEIPEKDLLEKYVKDHKTEKGILLERKYYGIIAKK